MKKICTALFLFFCLMLMLFFPEPVKKGAQEGLTLWYNSVVPILFPFLLLSNAILSTGSMSILLRPFFVLAKRMPGVNPWIFYPLFFGLFCGFPMGGKTISDLVKTKKLTQKEASFLLPLVSQASPMFLAGYVGVHILQKELSFGQILFYIYTPPMVFLLFYLFLSPLRKGKKSSFSGKEKNSMLLSTEHTIWNSFTIIVNIGIYMMLFSIAARLCLVLLPENHLFNLIISCLEFSTGLHRLSHAVFLPSPMRTGLILALTSFGGFCTAAQTMSVMKDTKSSPFSYLAGKLGISILVFFLYYYSAS